MMTAQQTLDAVPGLTYRMLDHGIGCGYLPSVDRGHPGSGFRREVPDAEIERLRVMVTMTQGLGIRASVASDLVDTLLDVGQIRTGRITIRLRKGNP
jgi:hypothetical protein